VSVDAHEKLCWCRRVVDVTTERFKEAIIRGARVESIFALGENVVYWGERLDELLTKEEKRKQRQVLAQKKREELTARNIRGEERRRRGAERRVKAAARAEWKAGVKVRRRLSCVLRTRARRTIHAIRDARKSASTLDLLGCTIGYFQSRIERQFERGMTWRNFGEWHLDHILPCSSFDLTRADHQRQCFHWTNLRPLWAKDNLSKSAKLTEPQLSLLLNA